MSSLPTYLIPPLTEPELEFLRQLFQSKVSVTIDMADVISELKRKVMNATPAPQPPSAQPL